MRDRNFLRTILPLSPELDAILARVFEPNPQRRPCLQELRQLIIDCPRFTNKPSTPAPLPSPPCEPVEYVRDCAFNQYPMEFHQPLPQVPNRFDLCQLSGSAGSCSPAASVYSAVSSIPSPASSTSSYMHVVPHKIPQPTYQYQYSPQPAWYNSLLGPAMNLVKHMSYQPTLITTH